MLARPEVRGMRSRRPKFCAGLVCFAVLMVSALGSAQSRQTPPQPLHRVDPVFPDSGIREGIPSATVVVRLTIPTDGIPKDLKVQKGFRPDFDQSAIDSVRQWRFKPAMKDGKPIEVTVTLQIAFRRM